MTWKIIFAPLAFLWSSIYCFRRFLYHIGFIRSYNLKRKVISVGNLSFGGTGKTPHVIYLSKLLETIGKDSLILTRGYQSDLEQEGALVNGENLKQAGDEPRLLFENTCSPVLVGRRRYENFKRYEDQLKGEIVILDDGFQHLKIRRDIDIVLIDSTKSIKDMYCAPMGDLREQVDNLKFADQVLLTKTNLVSNQEIKDWEDFLSQRIKTPIYKTRFAFDGLYSINGEIESILNKKVIALSAIGNPLAFETSITSEGFSIIKHFIFKDHYHWNREELQGVIESAQKHSSVILTTEKDFMKIKETEIDLENIYFMKIKVEIENEKLFRKELMKRLFND